MKRFIALYILVFTIVALANEEKKILILGDSLTEGYQLSREEAFPALVEKKLQEKKIKVKVINGGVAGATSASGLKRMDWYLKTKPDILVLALGANDGLRGLKVSETEKNLSAVIEKAQSRGIRPVIAGMKMPSNYGETYRGQFEAVFAKVAAKYKVPLIPFLLEGVAAQPSLNLPDGIHPNAKGYEKVAETVLKAVEPLL